MGYNFDLGPFLLTAGGKAVYLNPNDGDEGYAIALGGGAQLPLGDFFTLFGEAYYSRIPCPAALMNISKPMPAYASISSNP